MSGSTIPITFNYPLVEIRSSISMSEKERIKVPSEPEKKKNRLEDVLLERDSRL